MIPEGTSNREGNEQEARKDKRSINEQIIAGGNRPSKTVLKTLREARHGGLAIIPAYWDAEAGGSPEVRVQHQPFNMVKPLH